MDCPETIRINTKRLIIIHYARHDYITWGRVPKSERFNPLRYQLTVKPKGWNQNTKALTINKDGLWAVKLSNFVFKLKCFARV